MAGSFNKVILVGNLTRDPDRRALPSGTTVAEFAIAVNRQYTDRNNTPVKETTFLEVTAWDRLAENCCRYLTKGSSVLVEGHLKQDNWNDKTTGEKRSKIKVIAEVVQFLERLQASEDGGGANSNSNYSGSGGSNYGGNSGDDYGSPADRTPRAAATASNPPAPAAKASYSNSNYGGNGPSSAPAQSGRPAYSSRPAPRAEEEGDDIPF